MKVFNPIGMFAAFLTLTEAVAGIAVVNTTGGVQGCLTAFVILFPLVILGLFVWLLVGNQGKYFLKLFGPSDYGDTDPEQFARIHVSGPPIVQDLADEVRQLPKVHEIKVADNLNLSDSTQVVQLSNVFTVMDKLIDETLRQHLILMHEKNLVMPFNDVYDNKYFLGNHGSNWSNGVMSGQAFWRKLKGTDTVAKDGDGIRLTPQGHEFAQWLIDNNRRSDFFTSKYGKWGDVETPEEYLASTVSQSTNKREPDKTANEEPES